MKKLIPFLMVGLTIAAASPGVAEDKMSAVQLAAAAKLIGKLGELRGSVKPDDRSVFLTKEMVVPRSVPRLEPETTGGIPETNKQERPKLPPIVLEMGTDVDRLLEKILTGSTRQQAETKMPDLKPFDMQNALTLARSEELPMRKKEIAVFREKAVGYLEDYLTPPAQSR